jgi:hypothetical protein
MLFHIRQANNSEILKINTPASKSHMAKIPTKAEIPDFLLKNKLNKREHKKHDEKE